MEYTYEVIEGTLGSSMILRSDGAYIPMVEANADYQAYLNKDKPKVEHLTEIPTPPAE